MPVVVMVSVPPAPTPRRTTGGTVRPGVSQTGVPPGGAQHGRVPPRSPYDDLVHPRTRKKPSPQVEAERDLVVEDPSSGFVGAVVRCEKDVVHLEDRFGRVRGYPLGPGFWVDGRPVVLVRPRPAAPSAPARSASGSTYVAGARVRTWTDLEPALIGRVEELIDFVTGD